MQSDEQGGSRRSRKQTRLILHDTIKRLENCLDTLDQLAVRDGAAELDLAIHKLRDYWATLPDELQ